MKTPHLPDYHHSKQHDHWQQAPAPAVASPGMQVLLVLLGLVGAAAVGAFVGSSATRAQLEQTCIERFAFGASSTVRLHAGAADPEEAGSVRTQQHDGRDDDGILLKSGDDAGGESQPAAGAHTYHGAPVLLTRPDTPVKPHPRPKCTNNTVLFELYNGQRVALDKIRYVVEHLPSPGVVQLTALGSCGGFSMPTTKLMLRTGGSSDVRVMKQIFIEDEFHWLDKVYPDRNQVRRIMDFGSNCGLSLLMFSSMYPHAKLIGVEPELHNFGMLSLNTGHNPNIFLQRGAASARMQFDKIQEMAPNSWGFGVKPADSDFKEDIVFPTFTVPYLLDKYEWDDLDMLKVDIEGSELELCEDVLAGARWLERVRCISLEFHDRFLKDAPPKNRISKTCEMAMEKAGMYKMGRFGELHCWCRVGADLQKQLDDEKAAAKAKADAEAAKKAQGAAGEAAKPQHLL